MIFLTLDASSSSASVSVTKDDVLVYESYLNNGLTHSSGLMPMVEDALRHAGLDIAQIDVFGCVVGPGSFTGVRIGVATVKGLAGDKPCAPVDGLEALAAQAARFDGLEALAAQAARFDGLVCPILDARAGQVYTALFENGVHVMDDVPLKLEELLDSLRPKGKKVLFVGDGVPVQAQRLQQEDFAVLGAPSLHGLHASFAAQIAAAHPESWVDAAALRPLYLRAPQAERERAARLAKEEK